MEEMEIVSSLFESEDCLSKNVRIMLWFFDFIQLETNWLDEVAEGLKNVVSSADRCRNFFDGLSIELFWKAKTPKGWDIIIQTMRQALYTMGVIAH